MLSAIPAASRVILQRSPFNLPTTILIIRGHAIEIMDGFIVLAILRLIMIVSIIIKVLKEFIRTLHQLPSLTHGFNLFHEADTLPGATGRARELRVIV